ncbi:hypothetical protein B0H11DRAFT_337041 [Mycena galericulata]|nr:hypothetical protein B0H11DRAFT_337041 [Mycena galericulata]
MSETTPSAKRKRADLETPESSPTHSKIWMPYGDIILQAESTQFRVNRDVLAQQSPVFKDMFSVPQPPNEVAVEGCPIVQVSDTAKDWELLLGVLYDPFQDQDTLSFDVIASMLRLGRKYDISAAVKNATRRIRYEFPNQLDAWLNFNAARDPTPIESRAGIAVDLLNLAYEFGIKSSIPTIAFCCLRGFTLEKLLRGPQRPDGSRIILPNDIKQTVVIAAERILNYQHQVFRWLDDDSVIPHELCNSLTCTDQRHEIRRSMAWGYAADEFRYFALDQWDEDWSDALCSACLQAGKRAFRASGRKFWESLPGFFGLPKWKDLTDLD